jgi:hypothetical protein
VACLWDGDAKGLNSNESPLNSNRQLSDSITACSFAPKLIENETK